MRLQQRMEGGSFCICFELVIRRRSPENRGREQLCKPLEQRHSFTRNLRTPPPAAVTENGGGLEYFARNNVTLIPTSSTALTSRIIAPFTSSFVKYGLHSPFRRLTQRKKSTMLALPKEGREGAASHSGAFLMEPPLTRVGPFSSVDQGCIIALRQP